MALIRKLYFPLWAVGDLHRLRLRQGSVVLWAHGILQRRGQAFLDCRTGSIVFSTVTIAAADDH